MIFTLSVDDWWNERSMSIESRSQDWIGHLKINMVKEVL